MPFGLYWRRRLTRLEAALYAAIMAALVALVADVLLEHMEMAERAAVETTVQRVNAGLDAAVAAQLVRGTLGETAGWGARNPFEVARMEPLNFAAGVQVPGRGEWAFDPVRRELAYRPSLSRHLRTQESDGVLRFRLQAKPPAGYVLVPTQGYVWGP